MANKIELPPRRPTVPLADVIREKVTNLDCITQGLWEHLTTIFVAIEKTVHTDPAIAAGLAKVGAFVMETSTGELGAIGVYLDRTSKELH